MQVAVVGDGGVGDDVGEVHHGALDVREGRGDGLGDRAVAAADVDQRAQPAEHAGVFRGLGSLVDVGGGHGAVAKAIAAAFPDIKCTVMDLPHVVADAPVSDDGNLHLVAGDMFQSIPPADAVLLKVRTT